tara:strand:- start:1551 stop:2126 length:576 start_codon:yes stop_codon:yes gene_type:complete
MKTLNLDKVIERFTSKVYKYHELFRFPLKGELHEDLWAQSIEEAEEIQVPWAGGSHSTGADVIVEGYTNARYQNKGGEYNPESNTLTWSGSRSTKHATLEAKLHFFDEDKYDNYVFLSRNKKEWKDGIKKYYLFIVDAKKFNYSSLKWNTTSAGWAGHSENINASITRSMSDQLWTTCSLDMLGDPVVIEV